MTLEYNYSKMSVKKFSKTIRTWWRRQKKEHTQKRYDRRLRFFGWSNNKKNSLQKYWRKYSTFLLTSTYFLISILISIFIQSLFFNFDNKTLFNFYTSAGSMTGGMLAIIFTFTTLLVNYALTEYPPQFFKISGYDKRQDAIYFILAFCSIAFFILGLCYGGDLKQNFTLNIISIMLLFIVFYLIFLSYLTIRKRLNPLTAFNAYIVRPAINLLIEADKKATKIAKMLAADPKAKDKNIDLQSKQQAQILLREHYDTLDNYIAILYDYHDMLIEKKKYSAALRVLDGVRTIVMQYIIVRKNNLILLPTQYLMVLETDAQSFFGNNFERLVARTSQYIDLNNVEGIRHTIISFNTIGQALAQLKFSTPINDNPPFEQCLGYLNQVRDISIEKKNVEACFKLAEVYGYLGAASVEKNFYHGQSYACDSLLNLYVYSVSTKQTVVGSQIIWSFGLISNYFVRRTDGVVHDTDFNLYIDKYKMLLKYHLISKSNHDDLSTNTTQDILLPIINLRKYIYKLIEQGSNTRNPQRTSNQREAIEAIDLIRDIARMLSEIENTTVIDRYFYLQILGNIESLIYTLIDLSTKIHWKRTHDNITSNLLWSINQFGFGLRNIDNKIKNSYIRDISVKITNVAIYALSKNSFDTTETCIKLLRVLANTYMNTGASDKEYEAPRIMLNIYILGVISLHKNNMPLLRFTKNNMEGFNKDFMNKFFPNGLKIPNGARYMGAYPMQINYEISKLIKDDEFLMSNRHNHIGEISSIEYANRTFPNITEEEFIAVKKYYKK